MIRESMHRGKNVCTGEWAYGSLIKDDQGNHYIASGFKVEVYNGKTYLMLQDCHQVIEETVGEFSGSLDRKENKVFEGDICRFVPEDSDAYMDRDWELREDLVDTFKNEEELFAAMAKHEDEYLEKHRRNRIVKFQNSLFYCRGFFGYEGQTVNFSDCVVVGNIYDNPELITEELEISMMKLFKNEMEV